MARILIVYSTTDGHTRRICERMQQRIGDAHEVSVVAVAEDPDVDIVPYDTVVIGASIRYGKHQPEVFDFITKNRKLLEARPNAFFTVNLVARKAEKCTPETNPYLLKFLRKIDWQPRELGVFAGKVDYPSYGFIDRTMIRFIMWMTKGPTDPTLTIEYTDWDAVDAFAERIAAAA